MFNDNDKKQISIQKKNQNSSSLASLSSDPLQTIFSFLDTDSLYQVSKTCLGFFVLANFELKKKFLASLLLQTVMAADPAEVKKMLTQLKQAHPYVCFAIIQTKCKEGSRKWKNVSALEFAAWVGDTEIIDILLDSVPAKYKSIALKQLEGVKTNGTEHGQRMHPYKELIAAYKSYNQNVNKFNWECPENAEYCVKVIGKKQSQLPIVGLQWLCDDKLFNYTAEQSFKRSPMRICIIDDESISPLKLNGLGITVYIFKKIDGGAALNDEATCGMAQEPNAFSELCRVKASELDARIANLATEVTVEDTKKMGRKSG